MLLKIAVKAKNLKMNCKNKCLGDLAIYETIPKWREKYSERENMADYALAEAFSVNFMQNSDLHTGLAVGFVSNFGIRSHADFLAAISKKVGLEIIQISFYSHKHPPTKAKSGDGIIFNIKPLAIVGGTRAFRNNHATLNQGTSKGLFIEIK
jgi:hypothetical protein